MSLESSSTPDPIITTAADRAAEARRRTRATFLQGLAVDVAVAVSVVILAGMDTITDKGGLVILAIAVGKSILTAIATYVVRTFVRPVAPPAE